MGPLPGVQILLSVILSFVATMSSAQVCDPKDLLADSIKVWVVGSVDQSLGEFDRHLDLLRVEPSRLISSIAAGELPDVVVSPEDTLHTLISMGSLIPLSDVVGGFEPIMPASQMIEVAGVPYALPLYATGRVWVVRQDLVKRYGFSLPFEGDEVFEFLESAYADGHPIVLDYRSGEALAADFLSVLNGLSSSNNGTAAFPLIKTETVEKALSLLQRVVDHSPDRPLTWFSDFWMVGTLRWRRGQPLPIWPTGRWKSRDGSWMLWSSRRQFCHRT